MKYTSRSAEQLPWVPDSLKKNLRFWVPNSLNFFFERVWYPATNSLWGRNCGNGCPRKKTTALINSNGTCFILIMKEMFLLKSAIIRIILYIFSSIFKYLVAKLKISKPQNCTYIKTRAAALAILKKNLESGSNDTSLHFVEFLMCTIAIEPLTPFN